MAAVVSHARSISVKYWGPFQVVALMVNLLCVDDTFSSFFFFVLAELEFVQIIIIIVVITVMVVVIICLLNHYKLSTRSFINRQSQSRRQEETLQTVSVTPWHQTPFPCAVQVCSKASQRDLVQATAGKTSGTTFSTRIIRSFTRVVFICRKQIWNTNLKYTVFDYF